MMVQLKAFATGVIKNATEGRNVLVVHWDDMIGDGVYDQEKSVVQIWHGLDYLKPVMEKS